MNSVEAKKIPLVLTIFEARGFEYKVERYRTPDNEWVMFGMT